MDKETALKQLDTLKKKHEYVLNQLSVIGSVDYNKATQYRAALKKIKEEIESANNQLDELEAQSGIKFLNGKREKSKVKVEPPEIKVFPWEK